MVPAAARHSRYSGSPAAAAVERDDGGGGASVEHEHKPHPKNTPGPFYVVDGCCTACDVPVSEAPDLFTYDESNHCYVKRQPRTEEEFDRAFRAAWAAELQCVRYRGDDPAVLR